MNILRHWLSAATVLALAAALQAAPAAHAAPVADAYPAPANSTMARSLNLLVPGMTTDQVSATLGRPDHVGGSLHGDQPEWEYLLVLPASAPAPHDTASCQLRVVYDANMRASAFHWFPSVCNRLAWDAGEPAVPVTVTDASPPPSWLIA